MKTSDTANPFPKSEDWLPLLLCGLELLVDPYPARILESFEAWNFRNKLRPQLRQLERSKFLERRGPRDNPTLHLTPRGHLAALGGIDPRQRWRRSWDGKWRLIVFDLPLRARAARMRLWRWLRDQRFGLLQRSVWLSPDTVDAKDLPFHQFKIIPEAFCVMEGRPAVPDSDVDLVNSAWDFPEINRKYKAVLDLAAQGRELFSSPGAEPLKLRQWLASDRLAWLEALESDPLLPEALLPPGYLGREAFQQRQSSYESMAKQQKR